MSKTLKLTGVRLQKYEKYEKTAPKSTLEIIKKNLLKQEKQAQKAKERRKLIKDLKVGQKLQEAKDQDDFLKQEEQFLNIIQKQEKIIKKQEHQLEKKRKKDERETIKQAKRDAKDKTEYRVVLFGHFEIIYRDRVSKNVVEVIDNFNVKGKHRLNKTIREKEESFRQLYGDGTPLYGKEHLLKTLKQITHEISPLKPLDVPITKIPMRNAFTLRRDWLQYAEGITEQSFTDMKGICVYELLVERLKSYAKNINKEKLFEIFNQFISTQSPKYLQDEPFNGTFTMESGVNSDMIKYLCEKKKISMYGFDANENCFMKYITTQKSNYKPIAFYNIDGHMYLITADETIKSLSSSQKADKNVVVSSLLEIEQKQSENRPHIECSSFDEALSQQNAIVYLAQLDMTEEIRTYIKTNQSIPKLKVNHHKIVEAYFKSKQLTIICDQNISEGYTWKDIKCICDKTNIPFTNQRIGGVISSLRQKFFKPERKVLTDEEKRGISAKQQNKCNDCQNEEIEFEYDHINPIVCGGSNDLSNFQALCSECHFQKTNFERDTGDFIKYDNIASSFNHQALEIVKSFSFKQWAFIEKLLPAKEGDIIHKIDHAKCRRNLTMFSNYDFPMFSVMDYPTAYDGKNIKCGYYFVKTQNYFPFRGNGWYSHALVDEALKLNIISIDEITHQFISSFTIKKDHFRSFVSFLVDSSKNVGLDKLIVNSLVGCWGIQQTEFETIRMTLDKYEASRELLRENVYVSSDKIDDNNTLYSIIERKQIDKDDMYLPLYNQILAMEAIELYKLEQFIILQGGKPLERNTDGILYSGSKINIDSFFWDTDKIVPKYRYDDPTLLRVEKVCQFKRQDDFTPADFNWNDFQEIDDFDTLAQQIYDSNKGCFVTAVAGAGKTFLANKLITLIENNGQKAIKLAPTRKAASHINGMTIHKYYLKLFLSNNYEKKLLKNLKNIHYAIVEEISMVKEVFYRFFTLMKRFAPHLKFIVIGDYGQLKPVNDIFQGEYENSPALHSLCDGHRIILRKCRRSDQKVFDVSNQARKGETINISQFPYRQLTELNIAYTHHTRKLVNRLCMDTFVQGKPFLSCSESKRNDKSQNVKIFQDMPIVSFVNDDKLDIYNSELFTIQSINLSKQTFTITHKESQLTFNATDFNKFFLPAYCITIHTSQGCSFDKPYTIYDWDHPCMNTSAKYVALSRARSYDLIQIVK